MTSVRFRELNSFFYRSEFLDEVQPWGSDRASLKLPARRPFVGWGAGLAGGRASLVACPVPLVQRWQGKGLCKGLCDPYHIGPQ